MHMYRVCFKAGKQLRSYIYIFSRVTTCSDDTYIMDIADLNYMIGCAARTVRRMILSTAPASVLHSVHKFEAGATETGVGEFI